MIALGKIPEAIQIIIIAKEEQIYIHLLPETLEVLKCPVLNEWRPKYLESLQNSGDSLHLLCFILIISTKSFLTSETTNSQVPGCEKQTILQDHISTCHYHR